MPRRRVFETALHRNPAGRRLAESALRHRSPTTTQFFLCNLTERKTDSSPWLGPAWCFRVSLEQCSGSSRTSGAALTLPHDLKRPRRNRAAAPSEPLYTTTSLDGEVTYPQNSTPQTPLFGDGRNLSIPGRYTRGQTRANGGTTDPRQNGSAHRQQPHRVRIPLPATPGKWPDCKPQTNFASSCGPVLSDTAPAPGRARS